MAESGKNAENERDGANEISDDGQIRIDDTYRSLIPDFPHDGDGLPFPDGDQADKVDNDSWSLEHLSPRHRDIVRTIFALRVIDDNPARRYKRLTESLESGDFVPFTKEDIRRAREAGEREREKEFALE
jgi:hypothetical protein